MQSFWSLEEINTFVRSQYNGRRFRIVPYVYPLLFGAIGANATLTQNVTISANADFWLSNIIVQASLEDVITTPPLLRILLIDSASNDQLSNVAIAVPNQCTWNTCVNNLPYPRKFNGRSTFTVQATDYSAVGYGAVSFSFEGFQVYLYN